MKKILFCAAVIAAAMTSCSKNEITNSIEDAPQAITFGTYVGNASSKATVKEEFEANDTFGVFAYYTEATKYAAGSDDPNFMYNQTITKGSDGAWTYSPLKYWPNTVTSANKDGLVSFFAYWPMVANAENLTLVDTEGAALTTASTTDPCVKYVLDQAEAVDLMWAVNDKTGLPFLDMVKQDTEGKVAFQFKHALARVGFSITLADDILNADATNGETTVTINSIEFGGTITGEDFTSTIYGDGILNLNNETDSEANWTAGEKRVDLTLESTDFTNDGVFSYSATETEGFHATMTNEGESYFMIIPQNLTESKMRITYTVSTKDSQYGDDATVDVENKYVYGLQNFVNGKAYLYNIEIGLNSVKVSGDVEAWEDATDVDVETNDGTTVNPDAAVTE